MSSLGCNRLDLSQIGRGSLQLATELIGVRLQFVMPDAIRHPESQGYGLRIESAMTGNDTLKRLVRDTAVGAPGLRTHFSVQGN